MRPYEKEATPRIELGTLGLQDQCNYHCATRPSESAIAHNDGSTIVEQEMLQAGLEPAIVGS